MAMNKEELRSYKAALLDELKTNELAVERLKLLIANQKKYIKLVGAQIEDIDGQVQYESVEEKPLV